MLFHGGFIVLSVGPYFVCGRLPRFILTCVRILVSQRLLRSESFECSAALLNFQLSLRPTSVGMLLQGRGSSVIKRIEMRSETGCMARQNEHPSRRSHDHQINAERVVLCEGRPYAMHRDVIPRVINSVSFPFLLPSRHRALCVHSSHAAFSPWPMHQICRHRSYKTALPLDLIFSDTDFFFRAGTRV